MAMDSSTECVSTPQTPLVDANKIVDISSDQLQSTSLGTPAKALEPAGLSDSREVATVDENDKTSRLRLRLQRLQRQLTQQQLYRVRHTSQIVPGRQCTVSVLCTYIAIYCFSWTA